MRMILDLSNIFSKKKNKKVSDISNKNKIKDKVNMYNWGSRSKKRMEGINPLLIEWANRLIHRSEIDLTIPQYGGLRTAEIQNHIFKNGNGATQRDGYEKKSYHQSGNALDVVAYAKTVEEMYSIEKLDYIGELGKEIWSEMYEEGMLNEYSPRWGGDWNWKDRPHWELKKIR